MSVEPAGSAGRVHDVVVVGAGPAGSMTALSSASRGASVLLVDRARFPRPKVCGCCVNPRALEALRRAGLGGLVDDLGAIPLDRITIGHKGVQATIRQPLGVVVSRDALDLALIRAAQDRGVSFQPETTAALLPAATATTDQRSLRLVDRDGPRIVAARFVVSATGLVDSLREAETAGRSSSAVHSRIGAGAIAPRVPDGYVPGRIYMACGTDGYVGLVVLEDGRLDVAAALRPAAVRRSGGIGPLVRDILKSSSFPDVPDVADLAWRGTPALSRSAVAIADRRVFRVGDSAGYVEPFTGEGIAWALSGGARLAEILAESPGARPEAVERRWADAYRGEVTRTQGPCRSARWVLRTPWLLGSIARVLAVWPGLAVPFVRSIHQVRRSRPTPIPEG